MATENKIVTFPPWINNSFIQKALHNAGEKNVEVESCAVDIGTAPGDNYSSNIYRVKAKLKDGSQRTLLIKSTLESEEMERIAEDMGFFEKEGVMLSEIVPRIQAVLEKAAPGRWSRFTAPCLLYGNNPKLFIVMDDLRVQGFRMADRKRGLGLRHCLVAIRALARYHAAGHVLITKDPSIISRFGNPFERQPEISRIFTQGGISATAEVCRMWPGYEECARRLDKFKNVVMDTFKNFYDTKPELFNVISHGDFWANNMLFRYDEDGTPCEHRMVDLQLSAIVSPTLDLLYFLTTSLSEDVSTHHQDFLIREYYFTLQETLSLLGTEAPSFETFLADMDAHGSYSLFGTITVHPIVKATTPVDMIGVLNGDLSSLTALYNSPDVRKYLQRVLPELARKGWLPE